MSSDPTANPDPQDTPRPYEPTQPTSASPTQPTPSAPPPPPPAAPPAYGQGQGAQPYPSYGQPPPPAAPAYQQGMYAGTQEHPRGTLVLILGILSIVICQALGPFAWVMGRRALAEIDTSGRTYTNRGMVQAGMICGIVGTVLLVLAVAYVVIVVVILGMAASSGNLR